jgi:hypothetical protein
MSFVIVRRTGASKLYLKEKDSLKVAEKVEDAVKFKTKKAAEKVLEGLRGKFNSPSLVKFLTIEPYSQ